MAARTSLLIQSTVATVAAGVCAFGGVLPLTREALSAASPAATLQVNLQYLLAGVFVLLSGLLCTAAGAVNKHIAKGAAMGNLSAFAACAWVLYKNGDVDAALAGKFGQPVGFMNGCVLAGVALYFLLAALSTLLCGAPRRNATKPATKKD